MWPLATTKPKHLLPIAGRPMISILITTLAAAGIKELSVVVGFKGELIQSLLGDGTKFGLSIEYLRQPKWTGTASAVEVARQSVGDEPFLAIYGDLLVSQSCIHILSSLLLQETQDDACFEKSLHPVAFRTLAVENTEPRRRK